MIFLISDYSYEEIKGGAEQVDKIFLDALPELNFIKSENAIPEKITKENQYIVSNFALLPHQTKIKLESLQNYVIVEHDYKFLRSRNPKAFPSYKVPHEKIINLTFYNSARAVFAQSKFHKDILQKNLPRANIISFNGTFMSDEDYKFFKNFEPSKSKNVCIIDYDQENKGRKEAINYCKVKKLDYDLIKDENRESFLNKLSEYERVVFFPQSPETYSKILLESKLLGLKLITNKNSGFVNEEYFGFDKDSILEYLFNKQKENLSLIVETLAENIVHKKEPIYIVIPYRDREEHRDIFIPKIKNHLISQGIEDYRIVFVEQTHKKRFNRGKLINIGFDIEKDNFNVFSFHDVDMLPIDDSCQYACGDKNPIHLSNIVGQFSGKYNPRYFGGVCVFKKQQFLDINGFYNDFWGWGAEDDDLNIRMERRGMTFIKTLGKYESLDHEPNGDEFGGYAGIKTPPHIAKNREILTKNINDLKYFGEENGLTTLEYEILYTKQIEDNVFVYGVEI
tara:strand:+ start:1668 stop:3194 length:1527 start_codon:yes stop_codon:yes gene_type:complete